MAVAAALRSNCQFDSRPVGTMPPGPPLRNISKAKLTLSVFAQPPGFPGPDAESCRDWNSTALPDAQQNDPACPEPRRCFWAPDAPHRPSPAQQSQSCRCRLRSEGQCTGLLSTRGNRQDGGSATSGKSLQRGFARAFAYLRGASAEPAQQMALAGLGRMSLVLSWQRRAPLARPPTSRLPRQGYICQLLSGANSAASLARGCWRARTYSEASSGGGLLRWQVQRETPPPQPVPSSRCPR